MRLQRDAAKRRAPEAFRWAEKMKQVITILLLAGVLGCQTTDVSSGRILAAADQRAELVLAEANRDESYGEERPFLLADYTRRVAAPAQMQYDGLPPEHRYWVFYETDRAHLFVGHPRHFAIIVDPDTLETEVMGGE